MIKAHYYPEVNLQMFLHAVSRKDCGFWSHYYLGIMYRKYCLSVLLMPLLVQLGQYLHLLFSFGKMRYPACNCFLFLCPVQWTLLHFSTAKILTSAFPICLLSCWHISTSYLIHVSIYDQIYCLISLLPSYCSCHILQVQYLTFVNFLNWRTFFFFFFKKQTNKPLISAFRLPYFLVFLDFWNLRNCSLQVSPDSLFN